MKQILNTRLVASALALGASISCVAHAQDAQHEDESRTRTGHAPTQLPAMEIRTDDPSVGDTYATDIASTATKTETPLILTPAIVEVIPQQVLKDQGIGSRGLTRVLRSVGVSTRGSGSDTDGMNFRGFYSTVTLWNGFRIEDISTTAGPGLGGVWMDNVQSLEVMKGPSSALYGRNEPGGAVNVITKRPNEQSSAEAQLSLGSWDHRAAAVDMSGPIGQSEALFYRLNVSGETSGSYYRYAPDYQSFGVAPVVEWRIAPSTRLLIEGSYRNVAGEGGSAGMPLDPATNAIYGPVENAMLVSNGAEFEQTRLYAHLEHDLNDAWSMSAKAIWTDASSPPITYDFLYAGYFPPISADELVIDRMIARVIGSRRDLAAVSVDLVGRFSVMGLRHTLLVGADHYDRNGSFTSFYACCHPTNYYNQDPVTTDMYELPVDGFDPILDPGFIFSGDANYNNTDTSFYLQDQVELPGNFHLLLGARYQRLKERTLNNLAAGDPLEAKPEVDIETVTPRVGLLWNPLDWLSAYYSYGENSGSNNGFSYPNIPLKPETARQHEAGIKAEWFDGRLNAAFAVFELTKFNVATEDPFNAGFVLPVGEVRSRGAELNVQGEIAPGWDIIFNISHAEPEVIEGGGAIPVGDFLPYLPNTTADVWTSYEPAPGWRIGGGIDWASRGNRYPGDTIFSPSYAVASAFASYELEIAEQATTLQLNVDNILDEQYFHVLSGTTDFGIAGVNLGTPRRFLLTMRTKW